MKRLTITIFVFVVMNSQFPLAQAQTVPSSARSREAIARVSPRLTKEVLDKGFNWGAPIYIRIFKKTKQLEDMDAKKGLAISEGPIRQGIYLLNPLIGHGIAGDGNSTAMAR